MQIAKSLFVAAIMAGAGLIATAPAAAQTYTEQEVGGARTNETIATAENVNGHWSLASDPNITNSTTVPHVRISGTNGVAGAPGDVDVYRFTVTTANSTGTFDVDNTFPHNPGNGGDFDSRLTLYNSSGTIIYGNAGDPGADDATSLDPGSVVSPNQGATLDSYFTYTFTTPGDYYIRLFNLDSASAGGPYDLIISLENANVAPEPATWAMMIGGFGFIGAALRRRRRADASAALPTA